MIEESSAAKRQVISVLLFTFSAFLFLAVIIKGESGWLVIHNCILGIFGFFGYGVPFLLGAVAVFLALDKLHGRTLAKMLELSALTLLVAAFVHIVAIAPDCDSFSKSVSTAWDAKYASTGFFGAFIGYPLYSIFKNPGAAIICGLLIFLTVMLMTGTTLIALFKAVSKPVKHIEKVAESAYEQRRRPPAEVDIPLDGDQPAEEEPDTETIEEKQKKVVTKYRDLDSEETVTNISSNSEKPKARHRQRRHRRRQSLRRIQNRSWRAPQRRYQNVPMRKRSRQILNRRKKMKTAHKAATKRKKIDFELKEGSSIKVEPDAAEYKYPPVSLLSEPLPESTKSITSELESTATLLVNTLCSFGVESRIINISRGPSVTRYELQPAAGVKISKITNLADDIALNLATAGVRIEAPIPNKPAVGIEVPNKNTSIVKIREIIDSQAFSGAKSKLTVALGRDISGDQRVTDVAKMPHGLIAGATGSGKSVCINSIIMSILFKATPEEVKLLLIDPKVVELGVYNGIPHLIVPVVTDPRKAAGALGWAVVEMEKAL